MDGRIYFVSNLSGRLRLDVMDYGGSVPEPLLPADFALQNPELIGGEAFFVFPKLGKIVVMLDQYGDENYQPVEIPLNGGFPAPCFINTYAVTCVHMGSVDEKTNTAYFLVELRTAPMMTT